MTSKPTALFRECLALQNRYVAATGSPMPCEIAALSMDTIRRAVELAEAGHTVFVPREPAVRVEDTSEAVSLREWDSESEF